MEDGTRPHPHDLKCYVTLGKFRLTSQSCASPSGNREHSTCLLGLCGKAEGRRLRAVKHWPPGSYLKEKKSKPLRTVNTAEVGYFTLFSKRSHSEPHQIAPPASLEALPWEEAQRVTRKAQVPQSASFSTNTHRTEQNHCLHHQTPTTMWLGGPPVFKSHLPGPSSRHRLLPAPEMGEDLCPRCGDAKPYSPALQLIPAGQEAKCTKIL